MQAQEKTNVSAQVIRQRERKERETEGETGRERERGRGRGRERGRERDGGRAREKLNLPIRFCSTGASNGFLDATHIGEVRLLYSVHQFKF